MNLINTDLESLEILMEADLLNGDLPPLDVAFGLLAEGYDVSAIEGHPPIDYY